MSVVAGARSRQQRHCCPDAGHCMLERWLLLEGQAETEVMLEWGQSGKLMMSMTQGETRECSATSRSVPQLRVGPRTPDIDQPGSAPGKRRSSQPLGNGMPCLHLLTWPTAPLVSGTPTSNLYLLTEYIDLSIERYNVSSPRPPRRLIWRLPRGLGFEAMVG